MADANRYQNIARAIVRNYILRHLDQTDHEPEFDVYVVWFSKTLQNWKALISTTLPDGMYYEVTHNGDKSESYLDVYKKFENMTVGEMGDVKPSLIP